MSSWTLEINSIYKSNYVLFFFYHINTIALYWQEKSTISMNINVRIDTPYKIVKCVRALTMKTYVESLQKQTMSPICNIQNSQWLHWYLPSEDIFQACCKSVSCWFSFSAERNAITEATEYIIFVFSFHILVFWTSMPLSDTDFSLF